MKLAKKLAMLLLLIVLIGPVVGCGVGTTPADNYQAAARTINYDARMMVDDINLFWQLNRPMRTSRWITD